MAADVFAGRRTELSRNVRMRDGSVLPAGFAALLLHVVENLIYCMYKLALEI